MKLNKKTIIAWLSLVTFPMAPGLAWADILKTEPSGKTIENVAIAKSASAQIADRSFTLGEVGAGVRSKKVAIVNIKVYVTQLLVSDPSAYVRTDADALASAAQMPQSAIRLDFLRSVDAQTVQLAFKDSLVANQVDLNEPAMKAFLDSVAAGGDADQGKALTIVLERLPSGHDAVTYEDTSGKATTILGPAGFTRKILSIWLGNSADSGLAKLRQSLITGN